MNGFKGIGARIAVAAVLVVFISAGVAPGEDTFLGRLFSDGGQTTTTGPAEGDDSAGAAKPAGEQSGPVKMTRPGTFEIHVQGADLRGVLQMLSTQGRKNIIATKEVAGEVTADLYGVTFDEALEAVLKSTGYVYVEKGNFIYVYTPEQLQEIRKAQRKVSVEVFHLSYVTAKDAKTLIEPVLSDQGAIALTPEAEMGIETSDTEAGGNSYATDDVLVVRDYKENIEKVRKIVQRLDVKPEQVLIEATILSAKLTEKNYLGIDMNTLAGIDFQSIGSATSNGGIGDMTTGGLESDALRGVRAGQVGTDFSGIVPEGGVSIGFLSNDVSFFVRALESVTDVTVLANPKILVVNKQRGEVMVGNRDGYITTTITETTATQTVEFLETGTRLVVRPYVGKDGYVRMELHPEDSIGSVQVQGELALPSEETTEVTSNVMVRDGRTIVIGGLFREKTTTSRNQIPMLGDVPYLGAAFRGTKDETTRREIIVLITPHIIKQDAAEAVGEQMKGNVYRYYIGSRKGVQWWARERIAQGYMRKARKAMRAGRPQEALWYVDNALSLEPRMIQAVRLKERLTEQAYWADEFRHSSIKYLIKHIMMHDLGKPYPRVVPPNRPRDAGMIKDKKVRDTFGFQKRYVDPLPGPKRPDMKPRPQGRTDTPAGKSNNAGQDEAKNTGQMSQSGKQE